METQKYSVNQQPIETILAWVKSGEIAIPEIQRPFVWDSTKVRKLMDSLYQGYPVGYLIAWKNPNVRLKDGSMSDGKRVLIDGQQRVTAMRAALLDEYVVNTNYKRIKIKISFHPIDERFEVYNTAIEKDKTWIKDIAPIIQGDVRISSTIREYLALNIDADPELIEDSLEKLRNITKRSIGLIELASDLDIETVTEIFIRINSQGVVLSNADFAMSKIASSERYNGPNIRKAIDYFCHLAIAPDFYHTLIDGDTEFVNTLAFQKMAWLKRENDDLYDPAYNDMLRVCFVKEFGRGRLSDLVSLLSGRDFEAKDYKAEIAEESFRKLESGIDAFMNETNFKRFVMIIRSAGFIRPKMIRSQNALNFAYVVYLKLKELNYSPQEIESFVRKWFVMSILTQRYSGSPESRMDLDIRRINEKPFHDILSEVEKAQLSDAFWEAGLVQSLQTSSSTHPSFNTFLAAQVKQGDHGFLSKDISVNDLLTYRGDLHHLFPRDYLKKEGLRRSKYNQVANYVIMQSEINIKVGNKPPSVYMSQLKEQVSSSNLIYGSIATEESLLLNLDMNAIPHDIFEMDVNTFERFLSKRRKLMAQKIKLYYSTL